MLHLHFTQLPYFFFSAHISSVLLLWVTCCICQNQPPLPPPPHRAGREFPGIYSSCAARVCTLCGWRTRARPECQLCPAHGSLCGIRKASGHRDHVSWCSLPAHMHTCTHSASLPQAAPLLTHKHIQPHSSMG